MHQSIIKHDEILKIYIRCLTRNLGKGLFLHIVAFQSRADILLPPNTRKWFCVCVFAALAARLTFCEPPNLVVDYEAWPGWGHVNCHCSMHRHLPNIERQGSEQVRKKRFEAPGARRGNCRSSPSGCADRIGGKSQVRNIMK